ncbi:MAG: DMT family transporter [Acidobacteriota bacterium]|nr:DMT family transporter [Acidobacteriota bacterium]
MSGAGVIGVSLGPALVAATSSVLQPRSARQVPSGCPRRLLGHLLTRGAWMAGTSPPLLGSCSTPGRWPEGSWRSYNPCSSPGCSLRSPPAPCSKRRPSAKQWLTALVVVAGLAAFLVTARPAGGKVALDADVLAWASTAGAAVVGLLSLIGWRWPHDHGPALLGSAAGIGYGIVAGLLKQCSALAHNRIGTLLADWPLYALIAMGAASIVLNQIASRAEPLAHSMPALTVTDPAASVAPGAVAFQEALAATPVALTIQILGFATMAAAAADLARRTKAAQ